MSQHSPFGPVRGPFSEPEFKPDYAKEKVLVPAQTREAITTNTRWELFKFWTHAQLIRRQPEAARWADSAKELGTLWAETTNDHLKVRIDKLGQELMGASNQGVA